MHFCVGFGKEQHKRLSICRILCICSYILLFFLPVKSLKSMQQKHILETQFFALIYFCCLLEILSTVLIPELQQRALTCGRASHCQVTVVRDLASGCSLHNPYQMVLSAPDHKNASLLPPHRRPEPGWRMKFNTRRSTNTSSLLLCLCFAGRPRSFRCPRLCHVLLLPPLQQPDPGHAAAQRQAARFWSLAVTSQVRVHAARESEI